MCVMATTSVEAQQASSSATFYCGAKVVPNIRLSSTFRPSFLSRSYQRPEDGFGGSSCGVGGDLAIVFPADDIGSLPRPRRLTSRCRRAATTGRLVGTVPH